MQSEAASALNRRFVRMPVYSFWGNHLTAFLKMADITDVPPTQKEFLHPAAHLLCSSSFLSCKEHMEVLNTSLSDDTVFSEPQYVNLINDKLLNKMYFFWSNRLKYV